MVLEDADSHSRKYTFTGAKRVTAHIAIKDRKQRAITLAFVLKNFPSGLFCSVRELSSQNDITNIKLTGPT